MQDNPQFLKDLELGLKSEDSSMKYLEEIFGELWNTGTDLGQKFNKYDFRSNWELSFNDHDELKSFGKYQIREVA